MSKRQGALWNPGAYHRFKGHRLRPAIDLLHALPNLPEGPIVDLGCGSGAVGAALSALDRPLIGIDTSAEMLAEADKTQTYQQLIHADIETWQPDTPPALIFSNAALQWTQDHPVLFPRLVALLAAGGTLAVQMPHQNHAPSHHIWRSLAEEFWPGRIDFDQGPKVLLPAKYHHLLTPLGQVRLWETEYYQALDPVQSGHPVRRFTESTYGLPILQALDSNEQRRLIGAYEDVIGSAYPTSEDGTVLFPFRRILIIVTRD